MPFNCSTRSNANTIPELDEPECLMRQSEPPNALPYYKARASREIITQEADIMDAWMQSLEGVDGEDAENVDEDMQTEDEELKLDL